MIGKTTELEYSKDDTSHVYKMLWESSYPTKGIISTYSCILTYYITEKPSCLMVILKYKKTDG